MSTIFRVRLLLTALGAALVLLGSAGTLGPEVGPSTLVGAWTVFAGFAALGTGVASTLLGGRWAPTHPLRTVAAPVRGRWLALNSPATAVPSHGVRDYGQSHAVDLVADPAGSGRPGPGAGWTRRRPEDHPAFGEPVLAVLEGTVVAVDDRQRDRRSWASPAALTAMALVGVARTYAGPRWVVGNHVTIAGADGTFALVAHLRRGSATVAVGDRVVPGQRIGECGNTGNSSEPHVHVQLMDRRSLWTAQGVPMTFADVGMPPTGEHLVV